MLNRYLFTLILFLFDLLFFYGALILAVEVRLNLPFDLPTFIYDYDGVDKYLWIVGVVVISLVYEGIYFFRYDFWNEFRKILYGLVISFASVFIILSLAKMSIDYSRLFLVIFFVILLVFYPIFKRLSKRLLLQSDYFKLPVKVYNDTEGTITNEINENWYLGLKISEKYHMVIINSSGLAPSQLQQELRAFSKEVKDIYIIPYLQDINFTNSNIVEYFNTNTSMIQVENNLLNQKNILIKYLFEKVMVLILMPFVLLAHLFISILIKLDSPGKVLYKQKRFGQHGETFSCYKYRSMYSDGDEILEHYLQEHPEEVENYQLYHKYENDPRITPLGQKLRKLSIDEFPQFYNVLRGDMNLIGPRPYMLNEGEKIGEENLQEILQVKPGLSGLWQVQGRNELSFEERIYLDKWYIKNWSLWMDFVVLMKTIKIVIAGKGSK
jgi:lipopolysaccharide/colanic/teichoic acid biosynthesis glycosyltransferase